MGGGNKVIVYKDLFNVLETAGYSIERIKNEQILSDALILSIIRNEPIDTTDIDKICSLTGLQPKDFIIYVKD